MKLISVFVSCICLLTLSGANALEFTPLDSILPVEEGLIRLNIDNRYSLEISDQFNYWTDIKSTQYFESKLIVFQKKYAENSASAHMLHVQFLNLTDQGIELFKSSRDYLNLVKTSIAARRNTFDFKMLKSKTIAERRFTGLQYVSTIHETLEEGIVYVSLVGNEILVLRAQELDEFRSFLPKLWLYAESLVGNIKNTDNEPLL